MSYFEHDDALRSMLRRARLLKVDDSGSQQLVDLMLLANEQPKKVFRPQDHGFTSNPPTNSEGYAVALGGRSDRLLYVDGGHKDHRPTGLQGGETCLYDAFGKKIKIFKEELTIDANGKPVKIVNASTVTIEAKTDCAVGINGGRYVRMRPNRVDLAIKSPTEDAPYKVSTEAGLSSVVYARID